MGYDRTAPKRAINVNEDLLRQAQRHTSNLSGTVESLLAEFVQRECARQTGKDARLKEVIEAFNAFHAEHGLLSDEFPVL